MGKAPKSKSGMNTSKQQIEIIPTAAKIDGETIGEVLLQHELVIQKFRDHGLQLGDIIGILLLYVEAHCPDIIEEFDDGTHPVLMYRHKDNL